MGISLFLQPPDHIRDIRLGVRLPFPQVKIHIQIGIVLLQIRHGNMHDMLPDGPAAPVSVLQEVGGMKRPLPVLFILFGPCAGRRIDLLQFSDGKGRLRGIVPLIILLKIRKVRLALLKLGDNKPHLIAPVAQMDVSQHLVPHPAGDPFHTLPDDG